MNIIYRYWASQYGYSNVLGQNSATSPPSLRIINARAHCSRHDSRRPRTFSNIVQFNQLVHCAVLVFLDIPRKKTSPRVVIHHTHSKDSPPRVIGWKIKFTTGKNSFRGSWPRRESQGEGKEKRKGIVSKIEEFSNSCRTFVVGGRHRRVYISSISTLVGKPRVHHFCIN